MADFPRQLYSFQWRLGYCVNLLLFPPIRKLDLDITNTFFKWCNAIRDWGLVCCHRCLPPTCSPLAVSDKIRHVKPHIRCYDVMEGWVNISGHSFFSTLKYHFPCHEEFDENAFWFWLLVCLWSEVSPTGDMHRFVFLAVIYSKCFKCAYLINFFSTWWSEVCMYYRQHHHLI